MDKSKSLIEKFLAIYDDLLAGPESIKEAEQIRKERSSGTVKEVY
jgi:hypothetical protein